MKYPIWEEILNELYLYPSDYLKRQVQYIYFSVHFHRFSSKRWADKSLHKMCVLKDKVVPFALMVSDKMESALVHLFCRSTVIHHPVCWYFYYRCHCYAGGRLSCFQRMFHNSPACPYWASISWTPDAPYVWLAVSFLVFYMFRLPFQKQKVGSIANKCWIITVRIRAYFL